MWNSPQRNNILSETSVSKKPFNCKETIKTSLATTVRVVDQVKKSAMSSVTMDIYEMHSGVSS